MLRIRLARTGKKHQPTYRIVVADHQRSTGGKFIEILGWYIPTTHPKTIEVKSERVRYWLGCGAQASDTVHNLLADQKIVSQKRNIKHSRAKTEAKTTQVKKEEISEDKASAPEVTEANQAEESSQAEAKTEETSQEENPEK